MSGTRSGRKTVVVDTDPGGDDAVALAFLAARPDVELLAVGSVYGNVSSPQAAENALRLLDMFGLPEVPVAVGADVALIGEQYETGEFVHGVGGLGGAAGPASQRRPVAVSAAEQLVALARQRPGEISLLALGPLTNLSLAVALEPRLPELLHEVWWMGGRVRVPGNLTSQADANTWHDPEAASRVLGAGFPLTMIPMDATNHAWAGDDWLGRLAGHGRRHTDYAHAVIQHYVNFYTDSDVAGRGARGCLLHDPMAAFLMLEPHWATWEDHPVDVELRGDRTRGMTLVDLRGYDTPVDPMSPRPPVRIAVGVDEPAIMEGIIRALTA